MRDVIPPGTPPSHPLPADGLRGSLAEARLCVLLDGRADRDAFGRLVHGLFAVGVPMIQLRDKRLGAALLADRAALAVSIARGFARPAAPLVIVNDRPDVAAATGADGVHVGAEDLPVALARRVVGPGRLVGRTAHAIEEARAAVLDGADMLGVGPCFPSTTKAFAHAAPRAYLAAVADTIGLPAFAIGGVTVERLDELAALGLGRVAVGGAITGAADPPAMAARFLERLAPPRRSP
jgi:thiamine-phosphate pyrophosphorylase